MRVRKILLPTDLSENSRGGLAHALTIAKQGGAELIILHVAEGFRTWEPCSDEPGYLDSYWPADRIIREASLDLHRFLEKHQNEICGVKLKKRVVLGQVVEKIGAVAREEEVDLIVMAPRPHGSLRRFLLGSVTDRVTREAPCPVLTVPQQQLIRPWRGKLVAAVFPPLCQERAGA